MKKSISVQWSVSPPMNSGITAEYDYRRFCADLRFKRTLSAVSNPDSGFRLEGSRFQVPTSNWNLVLELFLAFLREKRRRLNAWNLVLRLFPADLADLRRFLIHSVKFRNLDNPDSGFGSKVQDSRFKVQDSR
ncbi:hypothetical protein HC174_04865 [Salinimicrobium sp. CDJ15-81-2]|nr:hypothetical protein [Salinimicrobium nanhaiense]